MAEKKEILLDIRTNYQQATKEIAQYATEIAKLKDEKKNLVKAMDMLRAANQTETEQYKELANRLAANEESQKAYRKEIQEVSRSVQNAIIAEGKYKDTLKGKAAQLSIEKDKLRAVKIAYGELSAEYKAQERKVADLNAEVMALERAYGTHTRNVGNYESAWGGMLKKIKAGWVALVAVVMSVVKAIGTLKDQTQQLGDSIKFEVSGWKAAYHEFAAVLISGEGWNQLIQNMKDAYKNGKALARVLDEIFERENSLKIMEADYSEEIEQNRIIARDTTKTNEERIAAAQRVLELEGELAKTRKDIADQEADANKRALMQATKMTEEEVKRYVNEYEHNRELITQANDYLDIRGKLNQQAMSGKVVLPGTDEDRELQAMRARFREINANMSDELRSFIALAEKYRNSNDDLVNAYVESYVKAQSVQAQYLKANARTMLQGNRALTAVAGEENAQAASPAATVVTQTSVKEQERLLKEQEQAVEDYVKTVTAMLERLLGGEGPEAEIRQIEAEYRQMTLNLREQVKAGNITFEEATYYRVALVQKEGEEIRAVRQRAADEERKAREQQAADEARARQEQLNTDLQIAWRNADEQYRIKRDYLLRELELEKDNAGKRAELEQQLTELMQKEQERKLEMIMGYASQVGDLMSNTNQVLKNLGEQEVQEVESRNEKEKAAMDKRLSAGLISQQQYDQKVKQMDRELDAEKAAIARRQAIRERSAALFSVAMSTAQAIMKVWAEVPVSLAPVMTALVTAIGLAQTAAIISEPLPKARKGGKIEGASHEQGGVLVEAEGDERIVAAQPARAFPELLNLISYIGKHGGVPQTGYDIRHSADAETIDYNRMAQVMVTAMRQVNLWLSLTELHDAQQQQVHIDQLAKQ